MCGIAGIWDPIDPPNPKILEKMAKPLIKRGPDDFGYFVQNNFGFIHRRLSIIDIKGGRQPIFNEDRSLAIIFNGEIYDYQNLRQALIDKGHRFQTSTDTEVLIHMYEEYGPGLLERINGMFAFVIFHADSGELFLARDRFGQKPLFFGVKGGRFAFASGPQSLRHLSWIDTQIDLSAINDYLEFQYIPTPRSIYKGVQKLPPGSFAIWNGKGLQIQTYWSPKVCSDYDGTYTQAQEEIQGKVSKAVGRRLVADVPVGMFLSGGIDSSIICAVAQRQLNESALTFSIGFSEKKYDERNYSKLVAEHLGTQHHFLEVKPDDFDYLEKVVEAYEEPFCDASMLPTTLLSSFTRQHVPVALSGDGADELFGGYKRYRVMHFFHRLSKVPRSLRKKVCELLLKVIPTKAEERTFQNQVRRVIEILDKDGMEQYLSLISRSPPRMKSKLFGERFEGQVQAASSVSVIEDLVADKGTKLLVDTIMETDLKSYLNDDILTKVDRASMAHSLEVRSPFLDFEVAQLAMSLPYEWKQRGTSNKKILVDSFRNLLPPLIFRRSKMGFGVPIAKWLRNEWFTKTQSLLLEGRLVKENYLKNDSVSSLLNSHYEKKGDFSYLLFALIILELWLGQAKP